MHNLNKKFPFTCLNAGRISSIQLNPAKEGAVTATHRPGDLQYSQAGGTSPAKPPTESEQGASSTVSTVETGKLQQGSDSVREAIRQLNVANKELRDAVDGCKDGTIKGYPDLEIASINEFMGYLMESTKSLMANADRAMRDVGWLAKVKDKDNLDPQPEEQSESKRAHGRKQSPKFKGKKGVRPTSPLLSPSRAQEPASVQDTKARGSQRIDLRSQGNRQTSTSRH